MSKYTQTKLNRIFEGSIRDGISQAKQIAPATPHEPTKMDWNGKELWPRMSSGQVINKAKQFKREYGN